jgi:hypothetical protein
MSILAAESADLFEGGICELKNVNHAYDFPSLVHHGEIKIVPIYVIASASPKSGIKQDAPRQH